jgi:hypothetical protein
MTEVANKRIFGGIACGSFCLIVGLLHLLGSAVAFAIGSVGRLFHIGSILLRTLPDVPPPESGSGTLARPMFMLGLFFLVSVFTNAARCFYLRRVSRSGTTICLVLCLLLVVLDLISSLSILGFLYAGLAFCFFSFLHFERELASSNNTGETELPEETTSPS